MTQTPDSQQVPIEVDAATVNEMRNTGVDFMLLDVREPDEYEIAKIEGSVLIPMSELGERVGELEPHRERLIVVQCHHGVRSLRVTHALRQNGFNMTQSMAGGIDAWSAQIDPDVPRY